MARLSEYVFGLLLLLYPADLRRRFGTEMARAFRDETRFTRRQAGNLAAGRVWVRVCADVARTHLAARRDHRAASGRQPTGGNSEHPHPAPAGNLMETLFNDIRLGLRDFVRNPGFSAAATVTLAIGVGASVTMFSGLSNFVLDPLPFADQEHLHSVYSVMPASGDAEVAPSYRDYLDFRQAGVFESAAAYYSAGYNLAGSDSPVRVDTLRSGAGLFPTLGVEAVLGRVFNAAEDDADAAVLVISDSLWKRQFGANPDIAGTTVSLDGEPYTILGVMPVGFWFPTPQYDAWAPLDLRPTTYGRDARFLGVVARLFETTTAAEARARLTAVAARLAADEPATNAEFGAARLVPLASEIVWEEMRMSLYMLTITGILVLLIACVNVTNLLVAKGMVRRRELAVRAALGAGRLRLIRQYLAESLVLGAGGGILGLLIARFGISGIGAALAANEPGRVPRLPEYLESGLDSRVIAFAFFASIGAVLLFALIPALHNTSGGLHGDLREGARGAGAGKGGRRLQNSLVVVEMALTLALLVGAGLAVRSYSVVMQTDPGMRRDGLLSMAVALSESRYAEDHATQAFFGDVTTRLAAIPGADGAAATSSLPSARQGNFRAFEIDGRPADNAAENPRANRVVATPGYFDVLGATMAQGRALSDRDDENAPLVGVINESFARRVWGADDAIGARIRSVSRAGVGEWIEIVGVVTDFRNNGLHRPTWAAVYLPFRQAPTRRMNLLVRAAADPLLLAAAARNAVAEVDGDLPVFRIMTMQQVFANRFWGETLTMNLLAWCALGALVLAIVGIYGVISYSVTQRTHEMGVRLALGAGAPDLVRLVVGQGLRLAAIGIVFGLLLGFGLSRGLEFMLYGVDGNDPVTYASVVTLLAAVAALASYVPARRATHLDPIIALRNE